jgi:hypothetical protein
VIFATFFYKECWNAGHRKGAGIEKAETAADRGAVRNFLVRHLTSVVMRSFGREGIQATNSEECGEWCSARHLFGFELPTAFSIMRNRRLRSRMRKCASQHSSRPRNQQLNRDDDSNAGRAPASQTVKLCQKFSVDVAVFLNRSRSFTPRLLSDLIFPGKQSHRLLHLPPRAAFVAPSAIRPQSSLGSMGERDCSTACSVWPTAAAEKKTRNRTWRLKRHEVVQDGKDIVNCIRSIRIGLRRLECLPRADVC